MITKKDIPLDLLKTIEPIAQANLDLIKLKMEDNTFYRFLETDSSSKNYFIIFIDGAKYINSNDKTKYTFEFKPASTSNNKQSVQQTTLKELGEQFENWLRLIRDIHEIPSVHDDNFVRQYAEFYYTEFEILDDDANTSPFDPNQQDIVEMYLLSLIKAIEQSDDQLSETDRLELISNIQIIQATLSSATKNEVMKRITIIFGKLYKISKTFAKEIVKEATKHLIKKLFELGIEYGAKLLEMFSKH